jgi:hypothetical protein
MNNQELIEALNDTNHEKFDESWAGFMLNLDGARRLRDLQHQVAQEVVRGGAAWSPGTWSSARASQALYTITKVLLVMTLEEYKNVWLF